MAMGLNALDIPLNLPLNALHWQGVFAFGRHCRTVWLTGGSVPWPSTHLLVCSSPEILHMPQICFKHSVGIDMESLGISWQ